LTGTFPAFDDVAVYGPDDREIPIFKKAQLLAGDIHRTFAVRESTLFIDDYEKLTVFTDNVVPAVLRKLGVLTLSHQLAHKVDNCTLLPAESEEEVELRVLSIQAAEEIVEKLKQKHKGDAALAPFLTSAQLDYYLWTLGKEQGFRECERHATTDTVYY